MLFRLFLYLQQIFLTNLNKKYTTMKKSVLTILAIIAASTVMAQSAEDALRFSQTFQQGTARSAAMGGAFGALGGDISVLATNPAGMSIYKDGAFSFTPVFGNVTSNTKFNGFESEDDKFSFKLSNMQFFLFCLVLILGVCVCVCARACVRAGEGRGATITDRYVHQSVECQYKSQFLVAEGKCMTWY